MDFVFDSTEDFPVAANPLVSRGKKVDKSKVAGQKRGSSANPTTVRLKKKKTEVAEKKALAEDEALAEKGPNSPPQPIVPPVKTEEEARARKGKHPEHPMGAVPLFPQTYEFDETELVAKLAGQLPLPTPNVRYIWQAGFPPQYPDSVAIHLPGVSKTRDPKKRPEEMDAFSRECSGRLSCPTWSNR